ncbi:MAG: peptidylprolyl isomerase [Lachnospiraceae bacterium]|nr:peptidylprolyl isomerase [Lachnospiraceae bacterium]
MKKRVLALMLAMCVAFAVTACGDKEGESETTKETTEKTAAGKDSDGTSVESQYKKVEIQEPSKVDQMSEPEKGETIAIVKVKNFGEMKFKFFNQDSPLAVENFVTLSSNDYYNGITFHRVINNFMIQGGDPTGTGAGGESIWGKEFDNETSEKLLPLRGALCMANAGRDTNGSQFFIIQNKTVTEDTYGGKTATDEQKAMFEKYGGYPYLMDDYTVFGQLYEGYDVLDAIAEIETDEEDSPLEEVVIESITIKEAE